MEKLVQRKRRAAIINRILQMIKVKFNLKHLSGMLMRLRWDYLSLESLIEEVALDLLRVAATRLPRDVKEALKRAYEKERSPTGKIQLENILKNVRLAEDLERPICQDTGLITFYLKVNPDFPSLNIIEEALIRAVRRATAEVPLRPNAVDPINQKNTGDNVGVNVPFINWQIIKDKYLEITVLPKGGGSENTCKLAMLTPGEGIDGMKKFVIETVIEAGAKPCPPTIIGVGMGGGADISMHLAKRALMRPIDKPHKEERIANLERDLLDMINMTGIGPMGLGGDTTSLSVKIEYASRHPASFPVAVAFQCWCARRATARIYLDGTVEWITHKI